MDRGGLFLVVLPGGCLCLWRFGGAGCSTQVLPHLACCGRAGRQAGRGEGYEWPPRGCCIVYIYLYHCTNLNATPRHGNQKIKMIFLFVFFSTLSSLWQLLFFLLFTIILHSINVTRSLIATDNTRTRAQTHTHTH